MCLVFSLILTSIAGGFEDTAKVKEFQYEDSWFTEDKAMHFIHSAALASTSYLATRKALNLEKDNSIYISISFTASLGVAKEVYDDKSGTGNFSIKDLLYDIAGVVTGILLVSLGG